MDVIIELILIFITYLLILTLGSYYVNLYLSQDQFSKDELKNVLPYLNQLLGKIATSYSLFMVVMIACASSFMGVLLTMVTEHWFLNSAILYVILFFLFPFAKKNFSKAMVTTGGGYSDTVINVFLKYYNFILIGFGTGTGTGLMYNWGVYRAVPFLWFLINFIIISILTGIEINNMANQQS